MSPHPAGRKSSVFLLLLVEQRILKKCSCKLLCLQSCQKNIGPMTRIPDTAHQTSIFWSWSGCSCIGEGSPLPNTTYSVNLCGRKEETMPQHSLCTGTGLTGPRRCYSEAACINLLIPQRRPLVNVAQPLHDMAVNLRRMLSVTSGMRTEGGLHFEALTTQPIAPLFN